MDAYSWTEQLEANQGLDRAVEKVDRRVPEMLRGGPLRERLAGTWLGHPLHPVLTDLPIGFWTSATVLDLLAPRRWQPAATALTGLGVLTALPTAAAGIVDWSDAPTDQRRVGVVHAAANSVATVLYLLSFAGRVRGRRRFGIAASMAGGLAAGVGGYLGAHMAYARGVGVDHTMHERAERGPLRVTPAPDAAAVEAIPGSRYLVVGSDGAEVVVPDRCTRCGSSLVRSAAGALTCPQDASRFDATEGKVAQGPATVPLPRFVLEHQGDQTALLPMGKGTPDDAS